MKVEGRINGTNQSQFLKYSWTFELFNNISLWEVLVVLKRTVLLFCGTALRDLSTDPPHLLDIL